MTFLEKFQIKNDEAACIRIQSSLQSRLSQTDSESGIHVHFRNRNSEFTAGGNLKDKTPNWKLSFLLYERF